jgi:hypothetical protein
VVDYRVSPDSRYVGHLVDIDGQTFTITGRARVEQGEGESSQTRYLLSRFFNGYKIEERTASVAELERLTPRPAAPAEVNQESAAHAANLRATLAAKGDAEMEPHPHPKILAGRQIVQLSGPSRYGALPASREETEAAVRAMLHGLDPRRHVLMTGGTDFVTEGYAHAVAREIGFDTFGVINEGTIPGDVGTVRRVVIAGGREGWDDSMRVQLGLVKQYGGVGVFVGGGGVVGRGITAAHTMGVPYLLMRGTDTQETDGGASAKAAQELRERDPATWGSRTFADGNELTDHLRRMFDGT